MSTRETIALFFRHQTPKEMFWPGCVLAFLFSIFVGGCAVTAPGGGIEARQVQTTGGSPVKITRISMPRASLPRDVQVAAGSVWATVQGIFSQKTIKLEPKTNRVTEIPRPFSSTGHVLLVNEHAMWLSDTLMHVAGRGDLRRIDFDSNQTVAKFDAVGSPFATGDDTVWAYNRLTGVVTGIGVQDNRIRTKIAMKGNPMLGSITFGAGSLWHLSFEDVVANTVRRIDPHSGRVLAEIALGPICPSDQIRYVAGAIWILGGCGDKGTELAIRIDVSTDRIVATIPLPKRPGCVMKTRPRTPVEWEGAIWLSTFCTIVGRAPGRLLKIDLQKNVVIDQLILPAYYGHQGAQPDLAASEGAVWGFDGQSALRFDFSK